jgi:hypothetical protein
MILYLFIGILHQKPLEALQSICCFLAHQDAFFGFQAPNFKSLGLNFGVGEGIGKELLRQDSKSVVSTYFFYRNRRHQQKMFFRKAT